VRSLFGDAREARNAQLAAALREAERRAARASQGGGDVANGAEITGDTNARAALARDTPPRPRTRAALWIGSAAVLAIGGATALLFARNTSTGVTNENEASARAPAAPVIAEPPAPPVTNPAPSASAAPVEPSIAPAATTSAPASERSSTRSKRASSSRTKKASEEPPKAKPEQPKPRPGVSPVRSPGF
jgi:hypothetical protein